MMKLSLKLEAGTRPYLPVITTALLLILGFFWAATVGRLIMQSQAGHIAILLVKVAFIVIPPSIWLGASFISIFWCVMMVRLWRAVYPPPPAA
jgi:hypothetical protein